MLLSNVFKSTVILSHCGAKRSIPSNMYILQTHVEVNVVSATQVPGRL